MQKQKKMLPIKEDDKSFSSKIVTKESSMANPSFRVYYGGNPIAVPFVWEAKPGTPKHTKHSFSNNEKENKEYLPPLTPPPSYYLNVKPNKLPSNSSKKFSSKIFLGFLPKRNKHRRKISSTSSSSSSTLSCPSSSMLVPDSTMRSSEQSQSQSRSLSRAPKGRTMSSPSGSLFDFLVNGKEDDDQHEHEHEQDDVRSPRSVLCFGCVGSRRIRSCSVV